MTELAYADTAYFTQFSFRDELQLRNKLSWVGVRSGWRLVQLGIGALELAFGRDWNIYNRNAKDPSSNGPPFT